MDGESMNRKADSPVKTWRYHEWIGRLILQKAWEYYDLIDRRIKFEFYGPFNSISLNSSRSLIRGVRKSEYPEKNYLTYRLPVQKLASSKYPERGCERSNV